MGTLVRILVLVALLITAGFYMNVTSEKSEDILLVEEHISPDINQEIIKEYQQEGQFQLSKPKSGLFSLIGKKVSDLIASYGEPARIDPTPYNYEWWIYSIQNNYMQVGVEEGKIVTLYALGESAQVAPFIVGQAAEEIFSKVLIDTEIHLDYGGTSYRFEMSEEDMNTRPLIRMEDLYVQFQIDKFKSVLSSIRIFDAKTLILQRPYELVYRGQLLDREVSEEEWGEIEKASQQQIFEITNVLRQRYQIDLLKWDEKVAEVAYLHSKDMSETNTFSHSSEKLGELSNRFNAANIEFEEAGENIAANYLDAPDVMQGWLNSEGHRKSLLNKDFTHIGVGVFRKIYTQNFIQN